MRFLLNGIITLWARLPLSWVYTPGRAGGWILGHVIRKRRRLVLNSLCRCFPEKAEAEILALADKIYAFQVLNVAELLRVVGRGLDEFTPYFTIEGEEHLQEARRGNRGILLLTAHTGNWELVGLLLAQHGYPFTIMVKEIGHRTVNDRWNAMRARYGMEVLPPRNSYRSALRVLKDRKTFSYALDQNMRRSKGIFVNFMGRPACTSPGLAFLAAHSGAVIVPIFALRTGDRSFKALVLPPLDPPSDTQDETIRIATQQYTDVIEKIVRQYPEQWLWLHRRWKIQPRPEEKGS